jgi:hypothetical protein
MISLLLILENIRYRKKYTRSSLITALNIPLERFLYLKREKKVPDELLPKWVKFLELPLQDCTPLFQYNARQRIYNSIDFVPTETLRRLMTDLIYFRDHIDISNVQAQLQPSLFPLIYAQCFDITNAIADIRGRRDN